MTGQNQARIRAQHLSMQFDDRVLFTIPELHFAQGDVIYLQGDNGVGKSTLMKILAGLLTPTSGQLQCDGFPASSSFWQDKFGLFSVSRSASLLGKAVYLHQHPYLFDDTVYNNLIYGLKVNHHHTNQPRVEKAIEMADLSTLIHCDASGLSGGERQRLAIARAWICQPKLLMLDEPISNMDQHSQTLVLEMIKQLKQEGTGLLISSHQSCGLTELCEQHWHLHQGALISTQKEPHINTPQETSLIKASLHHAR